ncbi:hypothetical protein SPHINGO361_60033 [Sphingomonas sp. EC-HK361]|nr:hypothetical protein SPHINGO361_60033 [Sphingomonas sp. EC-HK361]
MQDGNLSCGRLPEPSDVPTWDINRGFPAPARANPRLINPIVLNAIALKPLFWVSDDIGLDARTGTGQDRERVTSCRCGWPWRNSARWQRAALSSAAARCTSRKRRRALR